MGIVLETISECGYGLAWRILDSQYFGVPQRRRRVYIVGCLGAPCPPEILFEPEGGGGDTPAGGKAGEDLAGTLGGGAGGRGWCQDTERATFISYALNAHPGSNRRTDGESETFVCAPPDPDGVREATGVPRWLDPCPRCPDGRRYAALGDAVTVNVIEWIGRRILEAIDV